MPLLLLALAVALPTQVGAETRHLVAIAAHRGSLSEPPLRFSRFDAERVRSAFVDVGGVAAPDSVLLIDPSVDEVEATFLRLATAELGPEDTLVVYLSGHMDDQSVHLGPERLRFKDVLRQARGTGAGLRVFLVDGCRSGGFATKGAKRVGAARVLESRPALTVGDVVLTAAAQSEAALESNRLQGSFFTHYLVTGLRGAADGDGDGQVSVSELTRFVHDHTVFATAASPTGSQHPGFKVHLAGTGSAVLSEVSAARHRSARLTVTEPRPATSVAYLFNRTSGRLEAELELTRPGELVLPAGRYQVRVSTPKVVTQGDIDLYEGRTVTLDNIDMRPIPLLSLLRKGHGTADSRLAVSVQGVAGVSDGVGPGPTLGTRMSLSMELRSAAISLDATYRWLNHETREELERPEDVYRTTRHGVGLGASISHALDFESLALVFGVGADGRMFLAERSLLSPDGVRREPIRSYGIGAFPLLRLDIPLAHRWAFGIDLRPGLYFPLEGDTPHFAADLGLALSWVL